MKNMRQHYNSDHSYIPDGEVIGYGNDARDMSIREVGSRVSHLLSRRILCVVLGILCTQFCQAQFIPYSQYYNSALLTNPSQAGLSDYTQLTIQYRRSRAANYE